MTALTEMINIGKKMESKLKSRHETLELHKSKRRIYIYRLIFRNPHKTAK